MESIISRNPSTNETIQTLEQTPLNIIPERMQKARQAQSIWRDLPLHTRIQIMLNAREYILNHIDDIASLINQENGKPVTEAIIHDILPVIELITNYTKRARSLLKNKTISLRLMPHKKSYLNYWPVGVVAIISPWNFPFSIPFGETVLALLAGNAVILKPSEITPLIGAKIGEILEHAGLPENLFTLVQGDGSRGSAIIDAKPDKIFFTGSVNTGKKIMAAASHNLIPVVLELGGKDPLIILPDADLDFATSCALWGSFANSGQICASIERILVHESIHDIFVLKLKEKLETILKLDTTNDQKKSRLKNFGSITFPKQKEIILSQLNQLNGKNSKLVCGGQLNKNQSNFFPAIVTNPEHTSDCPIEMLDIYKEETFGPVVAVTKFRTPKEAVQKANDSRYGLLVSIVTKDTSLAEQMAKQLEFGSVLINDVIYTHGLSETPWGGVKETGFGRVHSDLGFYEFLNVRHIHKDRFPVLRFKPLWWFPYTQIQLDLFKSFLDALYRKSLLKRMASLSEMLVHLVNLIKKDKRI